MILSTVPKPILETRLYLHFSCGEAQITNIKHKSDTLHEYKRIARVYKTEVKTSRKTEHSRDSK